MTIPESTTGIDYATIAPSDQLTIEGGVITPHTVTLPKAEWDKIMASVLRSYQVESELRARVAELEGHIKSLIPFVNLDSAVWSSICTKCGEMSYRHGRYLVRNSSTERIGTCKHCPYMNTFHLMIPQPSSLAGLSA